MRAWLAYQTEEEYARAFAAQQKYEKAKRERLAEMQKQSENEWEALKLILDYNCINQTLHVNLQKKDDPQGSKITVGYGSSNSAGN